jgi:ABC-type Mn2+/Zn2+ transport system ATPase subunit
LLRRPYVPAGPVCTITAKQFPTACGGQQKLVALGRALAIGTRCLLLDEPFEGITPALSEWLSDVIASLKGQDLTVLMSQSDMNHSRDLIDVEYVIEREPTSRAEPARWRHVQTAHDCGSADEAPPVVISTRRLCPMRPPAGPEPQQRKGKSR